MKKLLVLALAAVIACSAVLPAACDFGTGGTGGKPPVTNEDPTQKPGDKDPEKDPDKDPETDPEKDPEKDPDKDPEGPGVELPSYETGDLVTDALSRLAFDTALRAQFGAARVAFEGAAEGTAMDTALDVTFTGEGAAVFGEETQADVGLFYAEGSGAEQYALAFLRGEEGYFDYDALPEGTEKTLAALTALYGEGGRTLKTGSADDLGALLPEGKLSALADYPWADILGSGLPMAGKLIKNALVYIQAPVHKTDGGFLMEADIFDVADKLLGDLETVFRGLTSVGGANTSINNLLEKAVVKNAMNTLLYGVTATELKTLAEYFLDEDLKSVLPEATADMGAVDYVKAILNSQDIMKAVLDLYEKQTGHALKLPEALVLGYLPIGSVYSVIFEDEIFSAARIANDIASLRAELRDTYLTYLLGEDAAGSLAIKLSAAFDNDYKLQGLKFGAEAEGLTGSYTAKDGKTYTVSALTASLSADITLYADPIVLSDLGGLSTEPYVKEEA